MKYQYLYFAYKEIKPQVDEVTSLALSWRHKTELGLTLTSSRSAPVSERHLCPCSEI